MSPVDTLLNQIRYVNRARVKTDVETVTQEYRTLIPRAVDFVHDNGAQSKLIVLSGTIPILYQNVQYNIPVDLFVTSNYPSEAPKLFVRPTSNMTVKANHQHVSPDGLCYLPYLHEWSAACSLVGLVEIASSVFSIEPPLFSRPPGAAPAAAQPTPTAAVQRPFSSNSNPYYSNPAVATATVSAQSSSSSFTTHNNSYGSAAYGGQFASAGAVSATATAAATSSNHVDSSSHVSPSNINISSNASSSNHSSQEERRRLELVDSVTMRMYEVIDDTQRTLRDQLDQQMATSSALSQSADAAAKTIKDLKSSVAMYTEAVVTMTEKTAAFDAWNADFAAQPVLQAADRLLPYDALSQQIVRLNSEILAIDDAFYYMERALVSSRNDTVDLGTFLKECRQLARKQFLCKAHLRKITAECLQQSAERTAAQCRANPIPEQQQGQFQQQQLQQQQQHQSYGQMQQQAPNGQFYANAVPVQQQPGYGQSGNFLNSMNSGISAVPYPGAAVTATRF